MQEPAGDSALDAAIQRLDRALSQLESRAALAVRDAGGAFDHDRVQLAAELDDARARERALQEAGSEAALALGRAIEEIRAALGDDTAAQILDREA